MTTKITTYDPTYTVGHYSSSASQLPAIFNDSWFKSLFGDVEKAFDIPNAVYPYNVRAITNDEGEPTSYIIEVALAGVGKNNIDVKVRDGHLKIDVLKEEEEAKNISYVRKGISKRKGSLSFALSEKTDAKNITSTYTDGLLRVTVPVKQPEVYNIDIRVD
jgi:HSP20 family molecular chaperone IbpA